MVTNTKLAAGSQRLYNVVNLPRVESHTVTLEPENGVEGYGFTFG